MIPETCAKKGKNISFDWISSLRVKTSKSHFHEIQSLFSSYHHNYVGITYLSGFYHIRFAADLILLPNHPKNHSISIHMQNRAHCIIFHPIRLSPSCRWARKKPNQHVRDYFGNNAIDDSSRYMNGEWRWLILCAIWVVSRDSALIVMRCAVMAEWALVLDNIFSSR